jgi:hypothetical protein
MRSLLSALFALATLCSSAVARAPATLASSIELVTESSTHSRALLGGNALLQCAVNVQCTSSSRFATHPRNVPASCMLLPAPAPLCLHCTDPRRPQVAARSRSRNAEVGARVASPTACGAAAHPATRALSTTSTGIRARKPPHSPSPRRAAQSPSLNAEAGALVARPLACGAAALPATRAQSTTTTGTPARKRCPVAGP